MWKADCQNRLVIIIAPKVLRKWQAKKKLEIVSALILQVQGRCNVPLKSCLNLY